MQLVRGGGGEADRDESVSSVLRTLAMVAVDRTAVNNDQTVQRA